MRATRVHGLTILFLFTLGVAAGQRALAQEERTPPPGIVIDKSRDFKRIHIGSPSMEILADGTYVASHDWFGPAYGDKRKVTVVFQSKDKGATWQKISEFEGQKGSMMFAVGRTLWHIGWCTPGVQGKSANCIAIRRSDDGGKTWSVPTDEKSGLLLSDKHYFVDPAPVLFHKGRIWKEVEVVGPKDKSPRNWATGYQPMVASAPQDADLLDRSNWTFSNSVPWKSRPGLGGWLEGNVLFTPEGKMIIQMRVDDIKNCGKAAQVQVSADGKTASYDPASGFVAMPGGCKKFVIKFDPVSKKYWSLVNWVHPDDVDAPDKERVRNTLALVSSDDLKEWSIRTIVLRHPSTKIGFQYCDWRIEGDDMVFVCRMGWEGAPNCHDANYLTFHRLKNFRTLTRAADEVPLRIQGPKGELILDGKGISLTPSIASCPKICANGEPVWAVHVQKDGPTPIEGNPVVLTDRGQQVKRESLPGGIRLSYESLSDGKKTWRIGLTLVICSKGDAFEVSGEIKNDEQGWIVCGFTGPALNGIQTDPASHPVLLPEGFGRRVSSVPKATDKTPPLPWRRAGNRFALESYYPSNRATMQWCALAGARGGLYLGCHDATHSAKGFWVRYDAEGHQLGLTVRQQNFCPAGKRWTLPTVVFLPYEGTWHTAARYYRAWFDAATPLPEKPAWVRNASGWLLCILKQQNGEVMWDYPSLAQLAKVADERGIDILGLFGWAHGGHDHLYPDYHPDPLMGGKESLRRALQEVHRLGKRAIIYANGQLEERDTEFWKTQGKDLAMIRKDGVSVQETWHKFKNAPAYHFDLGCLAAKGWCDRMLSLAIQANELGADGILFDQLGNTGARACYATTHGHPTPSMVYAGDRVIMLRRIVDHMKTINPDFIVMTEGLHDSVLNSISLFHGCVLGVFPEAPAELVARLRAEPGSVALPELFRYTFPEVMSTVRVPTPMLTRPIVNYACLYGFRYEIESRYAPDVRYLKDNKVPEASEYEQVLSKPDIAAMQATPPQEATRYLKQVIEFQRANADVLWQGRFADDEGFSFQGPGLVAKSYVDGERLGVLVWNPGASPATFTASVPGRHLVSASEPEKGRVEAFSPLAPDTIRLLLWKK